MPVLFTQMLAQLVETLCLRSPGDHDYAMLYRQEYRNPCPNSPYISSCPRTEYIRGMFLSFCYQILGSISLLC